MGCLNCLEDGGKVFLDLLRGMIFAFAPGFTLPFTPFGPCWLLRQIVVKNVVCPSCALPVCRVPSSQMSVMSTLLRYMVSTYFPYSL